MPFSFRFPKDENFISGIHNYCDGWCERCEFTARCSSFALQKQLCLGEDSPDPMGDAVVTLGQIFAETKQVLMEEAGKRGIDLVAAMNDPEVDASLKRAKDTVESGEVVEIAKRYALETRHILERPQDWAGDPEEDPMINEMLTILRYYLISIAVQVHSCFHAVLDHDGYEDPERLTDTQSYANGTAKITLIIIERSILSWSYLMNVANADTIHPVTTQLETIKRMLEAKFPNARNFIRPGFDELEMVM